MALYLLLKMGQVSRLFSNFRLYTRVDEELYQPYIFFVFQLFLVVQQKLMIHREMHRGFRV